MSADKSYAGQFVFIDICYVAQIYISSWLANVRGTVAKYGMANLLSSRTESKIDSMGIQIGRTKVVTSLTHGPGILIPTISVLY